MAQWPADEQREICQTRERDVARTSPGDSYAARGKEQDRSAPHRIPYRNRAASATGKASLHGFLRAFGASSATRPALWEASMLFEVSGRHFANAMPGGTGDSALLREEAAILSRSPRSASVTSNRRTTRPKFRANALSVRTVLTYDFASVRSDSSARPRRVSEWLGD